LMYCVRRTPDGIAMGATVQSTLLSIACFFGLTASTER
jgi:hypothetical protein